MTNIATTHKRLIQADQLAGGRYRLGVMSGRIMPGRKVIRFGCAGRARSKSAIDEKRRADTVKLVAGC